MVSAINDTRLEITFNKPVADANVIEEVGTQIVVYDGSTTHIDPTFISTNISFSADKKTAYVTLNGSLVAGKSYTTALVTTGDVELSSVIAKTTPTVLVAGLDNPTSEAGTTPNKFIAKFTKELNNAALTATNYTVYDASGNVIGNDVFATSPAPKFKDSFTKKEVILTVDNGKLEAGKTYKVIVDGSNVKAKDGTELTAGQRTFTITTPSVESSVPAVTGVEIRDEDNIVVTFDRKVTEGVVNLIRVRKADGSLVDISGATPSVGAGDEENQLTIDTSADKLVGGRTYTVELNANAVYNLVYQTTGSKAYTQRVTAPEAAAAEAVTGKFVRDNVDPEKANLSLTFDQSVDSVDETEISVAVDGKTYVVKTGASFVRDTKDSSGKTWVLKDVATNLDLTAVGSSALGEVKPSKSYTVTVAPGGVTTTTAGGTAVDNAVNLKSTFSGIDVSAPAIKTVTLSSAEKIVVQFDEAITTDLKASDISVQGFEMTTVAGEDSVADAASQALTGSQLNFVVGTDTITITPANNRLKFVTGSSVDDTPINPLVSFAANTIKDSNDIENSAAIELNASDASDLAKVVDNALPQLLSVEATDTTTLELTYSEDVSFRAGDTSDAASQFDVAGVESLETATLVSTDNNVVTLTFAAGTFAAGDYSEAKLTYTPSNLSKLQDLSSKKNAPARTIFTGIKNSN